MHISALEKIRLDVKHFIPTCRIIPIFFSSPHTIGTPALKTSLLLLLTPATSVSTAWGAFSVTATFLTGHNGVFNDQNWWCVAEPGWVTWRMESRYFRCLTCLLQSETAQCNWTCRWMFLQLLCYSPASPVPFSCFVKHVRSYCHLPQWLNLLCSEQQDRLVSSEVCRPERKRTKSLTLSA